MSIYQDAPTAHSGYAYAFSLALSRWNHATDQVASSSSQQQQKKEDLQG